jgi:hypothetical protein
MKQPVGYRQMFDFLVDLAEGLWKNRNKLIPSAGTPDGASAHTIALNHVLDRLIAAAMCYTRGIGYSRYHTSTFASTEPQGYVRILKLLDLMVLTHKTRNSNQLGTLISRTQGMPLAKYPKYITPLIPKLKARYQQYGASGTPVLDAFLRALAGR